MGLERWRKSWATSRGHVQFSRWNLGKNLDEQMPGPNTYYLYVWITGLTGLTLNTVTYPPEVPGYPAMLPSSIGCILAVATIAVFLRVRGAFDPMQEEEATPKMHRSSKEAQLHTYIHAYMHMQTCIHACSLAQPQGALPLSNATFDPRLVRATGSTGGSTGYHFCLVWRWTAVKCPVSGGTITHIIIINPYQ